MSVRRQRLTGQKLSCLGWGKKREPKRNASTSVSRSVLERLRSQAAKQRRPGKLYVVYAGRQPGVYASWDECEFQVKKFSGAKFKSYPNSATAIKAIDEELRQTERA